MLPETGTRKEFKQAVFEAQMRPLVGEVYMGAFNDGTPIECLKVAEIIPGKREGLNMIRCHTYRYMRNSGMYVLEGICQTMNFDDWRFMLAERFVTYVGCELPESVMRGVVMREQ